MAQIKINATYGLTGTLPAVSGANLTTLNASNISSGTLNASRYVDSAGVTMAETWKLTSDWSSNNSDDQILTADWSVNSYGGAGKIGSSMTNSTGTFSFPSTGIYLILFQIEMSPTTNSTYDRGMSQSIYATTDNSSYNQVSKANFFSNWTQNSNRSFTNNFINFIFDVTATANCKVRFAIGTNQGNTNSAKSNSDLIRTGVTFVRLGDT